MPYKVTLRTRDILAELHRLAGEVEPYIGFGSSGARSEWADLQAQWPSDVELREGTMSVSDADLEAMQAKVRRFGEILRGLAPSTVRPTGTIEHAAA